MNEKMTSKEAIGIMKDIKEKMGRQYKSRISTAWENGDYEGNGLSEWSSSLQQIRNQFGPTWLYYV